MIVGRVFFMPKLFQGYPKFRGVLFVVIIIILYSFFFFFTHRYLSWAVLMTNIPAASLGDTWTAQVFLDLWLSSGQEPRPSIYQTTSECLIGKSGKRTNLTRSESSMVPHPDTIYALNWLTTVIGQKLVRPLRYRANKEIKLQRIENSSHLLGCFSWTLKIQHYRIKSELWNWQWKVCWECWGMELWPLLSKWVKMSLEFSLSFFTKEVYH